MAPAKLKSTLSPLLWSQEPCNYIASLFKVLYSTSYWLWVIYSMGKCALILKGSAICSTVLAAAVKVLCGYHRVYLYLYHVPYNAVSPCGNAILLSRLYA